MQPAIRHSDGWVFPQNDDHAEYVLRQSGDARLFAEYAKGRKCVIQAGGYCGQFVREFAGIFRDVYTFEPNPLSFYCLTQNVPQTVHKYQAFLGNERQMASLGHNEHEEHNFGAWFLSGDGSTPTLRIDDLGAAPDLIQLDMEGREVEALKGGLKTIEAHRPVIVVEQKPLPQGSSDAVGFLKGLGYSAEKVTRWDWVCLP